MIVNWDFLRSRGFWTLIVAITPPLLALLGVADEKAALIVSIVGAAAAYFGVTITRPSGQRTYGEVRKILDRQQATIELLRRQRNLGGPA